jgi:hypothetical protein
MRMWMISPKMLCRQHLLGEHYEIHKMMGNLRNNGKWAKSLTAKGYLEPQNALKRHDKLAKEMLRRGYTHKSKLDIKGLILPIGFVSRSKSLTDLKTRCPNCDVHKNRGVIK